MHPLYLHPLLCTFGQQILPDFLPARQCFKDGCFDTMFCTAYMLKKPPKSGKTIRHEDPSTRPGPNFKLVSVIPSAFLAEFKISYLTYHEFLFGDCPH
jgi:hypothetical protein